jgi:hypothetical protein
MSDAMSTTNAWLPSRRLIARASLAAMSCFGETHAWDSHSTDTPRMPGAARGGSRSIIAKTDISATITPPMTNRVMIFGWSRSL